MDLNISPPSLVLIWVLQTALSAGTMISCIGLTVTFGRPVMRAATAFFAVQTVGAALLWASVAASAVGLPDHAPSVIAACVVPLSPLLSSALGWHIIRLLAGRTDRALPSARRLWAIGVGGLVCSLALNEAPGVRGTAMIGAIGSVLSIGLSGGLAWYAYSIWRRRSGRSFAVRLVGIAFAALAVRSVVNVITAALAVRDGAVPSFGPPVIFLQVFLLVVVSVLLIVAVLDDERANIVRQTEQMGLAEVALASSQRLESVGRMSGTIAHDFNNLLAVIGMSAESARSAPPGEASADLDVILGATKRGQELTKQLLAFARQAPQEVTRFDVSHQVNKLGELLKRLVGKDRTLTISVASTPQLVQMDATQFEQVLINLVVNARDATAHNGRIDVVVASTAAPSHPDAHFVRFYVSDDGTGIAPEVLPAIFEPFFSTKVAGEGTGLGLATCDGIVRRSGGRIEVSTELGKGTRFDVFLPRARSSQG